MRRSQILLDCDPGLDDALAVLLALGSPERLDVKAIVATYGNVGLGQTKDNLLRILSFFDKIPLVGSGSKGPISSLLKKSKSCHSEAEGRRISDEKKILRFAQDDKKGVFQQTVRADAIEARGVHGRDGLANLAEPFRLSEPFHLRSGMVTFKDGIGLIIDLALSKKIDTVIATGPLTDLAHAVKKCPAFLKKLSELIIMGGAVFVKGNRTPYAEFNFYCDPEAARIVLNAPVKKRLVSLDVTHKTLLTTQRLKSLRATKGSLAKFICGIADYSIRSNKRRGLAGAPMHDPLAVAVAIEPGIGEYEDLCLDVGTRGNGRGRVFVKRGRPNTLFCKRVDVDRFFKLFIGTLTKLAKRIDKEK